MHLVEYIDMTYSTFCGEDRSTSSSEWLHALSITFVTMHTAIMQMENKCVNSRLYITLFICPPLYSLESWGLAVGISCRL